MNKMEPSLKLRSFARRVAQEGIVLLENKRKTLPVINKKIALFGRIQGNYYKSGTGSGGLVNVTDVPSFKQAFSENLRVDLNKEILNLYDKWILDNPFNAGNGQWASEPWAQTEMDLSLEEINNLKRDDEIAVVIIGRTAGEDKDNSNKPGSYKLTDTEYNLIKNLKMTYQEVVVVLNVGNIIDMNFINELNIETVLYAWHGGQDGARALVDVLTGYIEPSGKLPNTIFKNLEKYPANNWFGNKKEIYYEEDIYVGYRFFETFMPEEVLYPFGYGLSYTDFLINLNSHSVVGNKIRFNFTVKNIGDRCGKEVVQVYLNAPQGLLGKPKMQLVGFVKTTLIKPSLSVDISLELDLSKMSSYDDAGKISKSSYVLEKGEYNFFYGNSVRNNKHGLTHILNENLIVETLTEALAPVKSFKRIKPKEIEKNKFALDFEEVPTRTINLENRIKSNIKFSNYQPNNKNKLIDVYNKKISLDTFVENLKEEELFEIVLGEGMSSPKVTPGTASAFGGVTDELSKKGIPVVCSADGPSGIRMDSGGLATSLPNGTLIASTFDPYLIEKLYEFEAEEMISYNIDIILGPGMNIQRHPLNGRNFEYLSEDPLLTGIIASSIVRGLNNKGVYGAMKHFIANNQETARTEADSIISERAIREIYLKGFEIAVKESKASVIMTSYNPINGIWAASNYDLNTTILRNEWNFDGIVMTDWWAKMNDDENSEATRENIAAMVVAQNDIYKVVPDAKTYINNLKERYFAGKVSLYELHRNVKNILNFIMKTLVFRRENNIKTFDKKEINYWFLQEVESFEYPFIDESKVTIISDDFKANTKFDLVEKNHKYATAVINDKQQTLYNFGLKLAKIENEFTKLVNSIENKNVLKLPIKNWDKIYLNLNQPSYRNHLAPEDWMNINKDAIFSYKIKVEEFGKYVISFEISLDQSKVTQTPFSIYVNDINKQTLTSNGTLGKKVWIQSTVVMGKEDKLLSFKFHKTGMCIYNIDIVKHG